MRKAKALVCMLAWMLSITCAVAQTTVQVYKPGNRATTLENGKKYMIYNTAFNNTQDRTGFMYDNGAQITHTGSPKKKPSSFKTTNKAFLWEVVTTEETASSGKCYLKAASGCFVKVNGTTNNATTDGCELYIQNWPTTTATKPDAGVKTETASGEVILHADAGNDVYTISSGNTCWNGNANAWTTYHNCHPYAFYEVVEEDVVFAEGMPIPGRTYFIYCDNDRPQYFYNRNDSLKVDNNPDFAWDAAYLFECFYDGQYFQFKNRKGKYLQHITGNQPNGTLADSPYNFIVSTSAAKVKGHVTLQSTNNYYFVMRENNNFDRSTVTYDKNAGDCATDFVFVEYGWPADGETYYIYSDTYHNGAYVNRFLYYNGTELKTNTTLSLADNYKWTCKVNGDNYTFQNGEGKYLAHRGVSDTPYNFKVNKSAPTHEIAANLYSVAADRYFVVNNSGNSYNQSTGTYDQTKDSWCSDFVFIPAKGTGMLTVQAPAKVSGTATWNGETKALPASWLITSDTKITDTNLSVEGYSYVLEGLYEGETSLGTSHTFGRPDKDETIITARFAPDFFSAQYGDKWVRLQNVSNKNYWANLDPSVSENENRRGKTATLDYSDESQLWCLVGNANEFVLYNKAAGEGFALDVPVESYGNGSDAMLTSNTAATWKLKEQDFGYALLPTTKDNNEWGINMYAGAGGYLDLYNTGESNHGSYWIPELANTAEPFTISVEVNQDKHATPLVSELTFNSSKTFVEGNVAPKTYYLPVGATVTLSSMTYRGYTFEGFVDEDGNSVQAYDKMELPTGGMNLTAKYTANDERTLFSNRHTYPYRIPAITTAPNGDIFAFSDYRPCRADIGNGDVDIVCRISTDNGVTWGDEFVVADGNGSALNVMETGYGDAAVVADRESNKVLVMMVCGRTVCTQGQWDTTKAGDPDAEKVNRAARVYFTYNEGTKTWDKGEIVEVTDDIYQLFVDDEGNATVPSYFIGSGRIFQSRVVKKDQYYRLYCSLWTNSGGNRVIYSDNFGETWNILGTIEDRPAPDGNEPKCEELPDGSVVLSSRKGGGRYFNIFTFNNEEKTTGAWDQVVSSNNVENGLSFGGNATNGEIYMVEGVNSAGETKKIFLQSIPTGSGRSDVAIYYKEIDENTTYTPTTLAQGWTLGKQVSTKSSAYSTMTMQQNGKVGFLFEEVPGEYCIVYIPYSISDVTAGTYTDIHSVEVAEAETLLARKGVGLPAENSQARATFTKAVNDFKNTWVTEASKTALEGAIDTYMATTEGIQLPEDGKVYVFSFRNGDASMFYYLDAVYNNGTFTLNRVERPTGVDGNFLPNTAKFVCRKHNSGIYPYTFVPIGQQGYVNYQGVNPTFVAGANQAYVTALVNASNKNNIATPTAENLFGYVFVCFDKRGVNGDGKDGVFIIEHSANGQPFNNSDAPYLNNQYSSAIIMEEVDYPNTVTLTATSAADTKLNGLPEGATIGTFSAPFATVIPEGTTAYYATITGESATLTPVEGQAIPANQGVLLIGESDVNKVVMVPATTETQANLAGVNHFQHSAGASKTLEVGDYILSRGSQGIAFYKGKAGSNIAMNKAYLTAPTEAGIKSFAFAEATGIEEVKKEVEQVQSIYDLAGRRLQRVSRPGIYIVNGKQVLVK